MDGAGELPHGDRPAPLDAPPPPPLRRARVHAPLRTGVRVVDLFTPLCVGQRVGVFAGSGVGKSSLLAMLARATPIDTVVIALVGERGREVREFLHDTLGENRSSAVAVVSTGDESPMMRGSLRRRRWRSPNTSATGRVGVADRRFGHALRACRARCGAGRRRARRRARLCAERLQRSAAAARARRTGRRRIRFDYRHLLRPGRRGRSQRSGRRRDSRRARRAHRVGSRHRRRRTISGRQHSLVGVAADEPVVDGRNSARWFKTCAR